MKETRRQFIKDFNNWLNSRISHKKPLDSPQAEDNNPYLIYTEIKTGLLVLAEIASAPIIAALGIQAGTTRMDKKTVEEIMSYPLHKLILLGGVMHPIFEEALFRGLPSLLISDHPKEDLWEIGIPISAIFALAHNIKRDDVTKNITFSTERIPIYQFVSGLFYWKMMRERGFLHAVAAHGTSNIIPLSIAKLLYTIFPEEVRNKNQK